MSRVTMDTSLHHQVLSTLSQFLSKATSAFFSSTITLLCQGPMVLPLNPIKGLLAAPPLPTIYPKSSLPTVGGVCLSQDQLSLPHQRL